ncbi:hypothetical protein K7432_014675 [Basidiobolus ranarum]|uniref:Uncharacterized protein n=1 Tax=Basidiobolus ranarum TaxID=34480 RepID=A0ABR2VP42_9FUNG
MFQLELEEVTDQRNSLIEELQRKEEELQKFKLTRINTEEQFLSLDTESIVVSPTQTHCASCCRNMSHLQESHHDNANDESTLDITSRSINTMKSSVSSNAFHKPSIDTFSQYSELERFQEYSQFHVSTEETGLNYLIIQEMQDLRSAFSQAQYENQRLTQEIQQKSHEFSKHLDIILGLHKMLSPKEQRPLEAEATLYKILSSKPQLQSIIAPSMYGHVSDSSSQVVPTQDSPIYSPEPTSDLEWEPYHCDKSRAMVREEMEMVIKSLEMLHLDEF